jgi:hypothetical protein
MLLGQYWKNTFGVITKNKPGQRSENHFGIKLVSAYGPKLEIVVGVIIENQYWYD